MKTVCGFSRKRQSVGGLQKTIHILTGPTAVGKTQLALSWAKANNAEIVSCDSLLFYRGMDIGTAKPTSEELEQIVHHCIDVVEPSQQFNIAQFLDLAKSLVNDVIMRGKNVLVTGGSGFYLKGFVAPVVDDIDISSEIESEVAGIESSEGLTGLVEALKKAAPDDFFEIDLQNPRRVVPALKRCLATGLGVRELREQVSNRDFPFRDFSVKSVLLQRSLASLKNRIEKRTRIMLESGLVEEVRQLLDRGLRSNPSAASSIGYREVIQFINGEVGPETLEALINTNTIKLVKKQNKWFRLQMSFDRLIDLDTTNPDPATLFEF